MEKQRADVLMVEQGLTASREKAKALIMAGQVFLEEKRIDKAGDMLPEGCTLRIKGDVCPYVSRGGYKLEKAMQCFDVTPAGKVCADIGASTGGFTDCMLQNGAVKVYSVDVGYGQLDWKLRNDERVVVMERTNARYLDESSFSEHVSLCSVDVSFISLKLIFPAIAACGIDEAVTLIKPQFEAGKDKVGKKGVVREPSVHEQVIRDVLNYAKDNGYHPKGMTFSPIKGPEGNIEYLALFCKDETDFEPDVCEIVRAAHDALDKKTAKN